MNIDENASIKELQALKRKIEKKISSKQLDKEDLSKFYDMIKNDQIDLIINTTEGRQAIAASAPIRSSAEQHGVYYTTTLAGGEAVCMALQIQGEIKVNKLQDLHLRGKE